MLVLKAACAVVSAWVGATPCVVLKGIAPKVPPDATSGPAAIVADGAPVSEASSSNLVLGRYVLPSEALQHFWIVRH